MSDTTEVPENYRAIAQLVSGYVDDKINEFRHEVAESLEGIIGTISAHQSYISALQANAGGMRDAIAELQVSAGESMPEHVYKNFIRAEAERLRIVKKVVRDDE